MKWFFVIFAVAALLAGAAIYTNLNRPATSTPAPSMPVSLLGAPTTYANEAYGFSIERRESVAMRTEGFEGYLSLAATPIIGLSLPEQLFAGTNLGEAGVFIGATSSPACMEAEASMGEQAAGKRSIGGNEWSVFTSKDAAAGNIYDEKIYRTVHGNTCYEIVELLHSGNIGNYPEGTVAEFDRDEFSALLESIVSTFVFTK